MTPKTSPFFLCKFKDRPDARCRHLPRCKTCGRVLAFDRGAGVCFDCGQQAKAKAAANTDPSTRRCRVCCAILQGVFADDVCTRCAATVNVKELANERNS
jgi:hypothetical protein